MQAMLQSQKDDTNKVKLLNTLAFEYNTTSPYDGIKYGIRSLQLAEELHWAAGEARANSSLGANYYSLSDFPNAYNYWLRALKINEEMGNKSGIANHRHNIGNIFYSQGDYTKALEYYNEALKVSQETGNKKFATNSYTAIGNVYAQLKDYSKALEYQFKALAIDEELNLKSSIAADEINIGYVYSELGDQARALDILFKALQIKKEVGDKNGTAKTYSMIGRVFLNMADDKPGETEIRAANNNRNINPAQAIIYLDSAIALDKEIGYLDNMQKSYEYRGTAEEALSNYKEALVSYKQYYIVKDSIFSVTKQNEIFNLEKKAEIEAKEREAELEKEKEERAEYLEIAGVGVFIVVLVGAVLLLMRRPVNGKVIDFLGTISVLMIFEFVQLLLHARIEQLTHHSFTLTLLCLLVLASIISRAHHKTEHWMKERIGRKRGAVPVNEH